MTSEVIKNLLLDRYPWETDSCCRIRDQLAQKIAWFLDNELGENNTLNNLKSNNNNTYWQTLSEILIADFLRKADHSIAPRSKLGGPDFLIEHNGQKIWIEVITPEPKNLPDDWNRQELNGSRTFEGNKLLLNYTAAVKEKYEKFCKYITNGFVNEGDICVIAINAYLLRDNGSSQIIGISQFPFAAEAVFPIGPFELIIDRRTGRRVDSKHQFRPELPNVNGNPVRTNLFLDERCSIISAIWSLDLDETILIDHARPAIIVHNPKAINPLMENYLPAQKEFSAELNGDYYDLIQKPGSLIPSVDLI